MRFLLDQDVYAATARHLTELGHDIVRVSEVGLSRATDEELLEIAGAQIACSSRETATSGESFS